VSKPTGMSGSGGQFGGLFLTGGPAAALSGGFRGAHLGNVKAFQDVADLTSLKLATPAPHSKPVRTSLASSLKRFKELSFDV